jgi:hypothetical protein
VVSTKRLLVFLTVSCLSCFLPSLLAQSAGTGAIEGTITDPSGGVIPGVTVTLTSADTNQTRIVTSSADGTYKFALLPPGAYNARFAANGFKSAEVANVAVPVTETLALDHVLEVGAAAEQVTITASAETLQTATSTLGTTVGTRAVTELPLTTRNYTQIIGLSAGASVAVNNASALGRGTQDVSVNGATSSQNNYQMDGVSVNDTVNGAGTDSTAYAGIAVPNPDAVQEFKIQTSTYDASYGGHPGANVNVVTKSGTNTIHGTLFEFFRNTDLNAVDFFRNRSCGLNLTLCGGTGGVAQKLNQNQFGGTVGMPIKKDKLFLFLSYQETRQLNGVGASGYSTPTLPPIPSGDRSNTAAFQAALGAAMCPGNHAGNSAYNTVAGGVQVACDGSNINPVAIAILQAKLPNGSYFVPSSGAAGFTTVAYSDPASYTEHQALANIDYLLTPSENLAGRFFTSQAPEVLSFSGGTAVPGTPVTGLTSNTNAVLKLTSIVTNTLVNEARISMQRFLIDFSSGDPFTNQQFGITPINPQYPLGSTFAISGQLGLGGTVNDNIFNPINQYEIADNISWSHGKHTIRTGAGIEQDQWNDLIYSLQRGNLTFQSFPDFLIGRAGCAPAALQAGTCSAANPGNTTGTGNGSISICKYCIYGGTSGVIHGWREKTGYWFVQDDFKVNKQLTLNLGMRWEYDGAQSDKYGNQSNEWFAAMGPNSAVPTTPGTTAANYAGFVVPSNEPKFYGNPPAGITIAGNTAPIRRGVPLNNFAPRFGFAYQIRSKLVVRGGVGLFYDYFGGRNNTGVQGFPYSAAGDYSGSGSNPYSLATPFPVQTLGFPQRWANPATLTTSNLNESFTDEIVHTPLTRQYNLNFQYEFLPTWVLEVGFVGGTGINQEIATIANAAQLASPTNPINGITTNSVENVAFRVPYVGFQPVGLLGPEFNGIYNYSSLQTTVRKQLSHGLALQGAYTWSKDLASIGSTNNPTYPGASYGQTTFNRPQRFVFNYSYDLPSGHFKGALGKMSDGWTVSGVTVVQGGTPLTFTDARGGSIYGLTGYSRAQICPGISYGAIPTSGSVQSRLGGASGGTGYFNNTGTFCVTPTLGDGTLFGNSGYGIELGPGQFNWDISLVKNTQVGGIRENALLQIRAEFFNAFNHPQFSNPGVAVSSPASFGVITSDSVSPRLIQFAMKYQF